MLTAEYIAGFFDGEGNISLMRKNSGFILRVAITNNNMDVLDAIQKQFGGRIHKRKTVLGRPIYQWTACNTRALNFIKGLRPHLIVKKAQALLAVEWEKYRLGPGCWKGEYAEACRAAILRIRNEIISLNSPSGNKQKHMKLYSIHPATISIARGRKKWGKGQQMMNTLSGA